MVGADKFAALDGLGGVQFNFKGSNKTNYFEARLTADDLYHIKFYKVKKFKAKTVLDEYGIFWEDLKPIFERFTGLYLSL